MTWYDFDPEALLGAQRNTASEIAASTKPPPSRRPRNTVKERVCSSLENQCPISQTATTLYSV